MKTILFADDEKDILKLLTARLIKQGYRVITAVNGQEALDLVYQHKPDLILLDYRMPVLDGYEACKKIKGDDQIKHIPVIFVTASPGFLSKEIQSSGLAEDYVLKPFEWLKLLDKIKHFIG